MERVMADNKKLPPHLPTEQQLPAIYDSSISYPRLVRQDCRGFKIPAVLPAISTLKIYGNKIIIQLPFHNVKL